MEEVSAEKMATTVSGTAAGARWGKERRMNESDLNTSWETPSWEDVVTQHSARVYRLAYRLTGNLHDAEDLTQEVFVRCSARCRATPRHVRGLAAPDHHQPLPRPGAAQGEDPLRRARRGLRDPDARPRAEPDSQVADRLFDDDVEAALSALPPDFRAAVVLCDIEGLSYDEIADVLDLKLGTVRSRIHRGRSMLRKALAHRAPGSGRVRYSGPTEPRGLPGLAPQRS